MHKNVFGRQFKRDANERKALFKNLLTSLVLQERIKTTEAKAKAIRGSADKLITKAKKGGDVAYRSLHPEVHHDAVKKLIEDIAPRFVQRNGGYTRIIRLAQQRKDNASMVILEWVEKSVKASPSGANATQISQDDTKTAKKADKKKAETEEVKAEVTTKTKTKNASKEKKK
jgi:large subunit ribosomal protein L17